MSLLSGFTKPFCCFGIVHENTFTTMVAIATFELRRRIFLLSLVGRETTGKQAQISLDKAGITANKNMIPFDPRKPTVTSGVRLGTPAVTTRGMRESEMATIGSLLSRVLGDVTNEALLAEVREEAADLCRRFPLYPDRWNETD